MSESNIRIALIAFVAAAVIGVQFISWTPVENPAVASSVSKLDGELVDRPAPQIRLPDGQGQEHSLSEFRGKVVFLNFWASFCVPCREEMPSMEALVRQYESQGLVMLAVSQDPDVADMNGFMQQFLPGERSSMTVLWDQRGETAKRYGTELIPETYIIDRNGRIVARFVNAYDWTRPEVKVLIESLIRDETSGNRLL
jgi:peroxiredoxin